MMIPLHIDPNSGVPAYRQIMDQVRHHLASGALRAGEQLPSIRELSKELSVNPATVVKAYSELVHDGVIENHQGKGAFISSEVKTMSQAEREAALRKLVRRIAVEALQLGASAAQAGRLLGEEMGKIQKGES